MDDISGADWRIQLLGMAITALATLAAAAVPVLVRALVRYLDRQLEIKLTMNEQMQLTNAIQRGIGFAEEQARKPIATRSGSMRSSDKLATATSFAVSELERIGVQRPSHDVIRQHIEAQLGNDRAWNAATADAKPTVTNLVMIPGPSESEEGSR